MSSMPAWLKSHLVETGVLTPSGLGRKAQLRRHKHCGLPTLTGLDGDLCAFEVSCDLGELTAQGEALALLEGRRTFEVSKRGELYYRQHWAIKSRPAGGSTPVLAQHICESPIPATWCVPPLRPAARQSTTEEMPF